MFKEYFMKSECSVKNVKNVLYLICYKFFLLLHKKTNDSK